MAKSSPKGPAKAPTDLELLILQTLWRIGPSGVRAVRDALSSQRDLAYTSVQTVLGIMVKKGVVTRKLVNGAGVFTAVTNESVTQTSMLRDLLDRVFAGSRTALMQQLLQPKEVSARELEEIKTLINQHATPVSKPPVQKPSAGKPKTR